MEKMALNLPRHKWGTRTIDAYEKIECIGADALVRQVFRAKNRQTGEIVALKKIRALSEPQGLPVTTIREIKLLKYLQHKNLIGLREVAISFGEEEDGRYLEPDNIAKYTGGCLYLVLDYAEHDLTGLLDRQYPFSEVETKCLINQLLEAIHFLHSNDYVHRDIKCSNVLLNNDHVLKLADFGLSRTLYGEVEMTNKVVTLWYRAPELLLGEVKYGTDVDMWSVGCVLAELYLGQPIFPGRTEMEQIRKIFEICGSPTSATWPGYEGLKYSDKYVPATPFPRVLRSYLREQTEKKGRPGKYLEGLADLIDDLLQLNPADRITAKNALYCDYLKAHPRPPRHPESLPPIMDLPSSHELQTKRLRRERTAREASSRNGIPSS